MRKKLEIILGVALLVLLVYAAFNEPYIEMKLFPTTTTTTATQTTQTTTTVPIKYGSASLNAPAIDNVGNGVALMLTVDIVPGKGRVLADINNLIFWTDTQTSIQTAQRVAQNITKEDLSKVDIIYDVNSNASIIEGPSAGAAMTIATVAALENKTLDPHVMITGTINPDGTIGPVGAIAEKATAAKEVGATLFLVPAGQSVQKVYNPVQKCENVGPVQYCTTNYITQNVNVSKTAGIEVKEVGTIDEALKYFLK